MSEQNPQDEPFEIGDAEEYFASQESQDAEQQEGGEADDPLAALQAERDELEAKLLRVSADYQNYARRAQQNVQAAGEQKLMDVARAMTTVLDHFDRALEGQDKDNADAVLQGVFMVHGELLATLNRFGVERLDIAPGTEFDPNRHEALMRQPSDEIESNHVTMQMLPGYVIGDKVIRPAQVGVAE